jgi:hypothetical protein
MCKTITFVAVIFLLAVTSCKKDPGKGGNSTIVGKVWVRDYNASFTRFESEYAGADEFVYIIYGSDAGYGDRVKTGPEGVFEFKYLRKGDYTLYVYSKDSTLAAPNGIVAVKKTATVSSYKKQTVDAGTLTIFN